ncbi:uncharacterized protein [Lepeophtheirus salmonis]|uniref:uncharacterized protein n=1 Tax=Lepeophtheirus salmonis TaxID=72036 RepID=UPI001AEA6DB1|nr:uncharacterized protein LOC121125567 [Lepeophtheirus salmonis]
MFHEQLIREVFKFPCLWKKNATNCRNSIFKVRTWFQISKKMGIDIQIIQKEWRNMRLMYGRELKKIQMSKSKGPPVESSWRYFKSLRFLEDQIKPLKPEINHQKNNFIESIKIDTKSLSPATAGLLVKEPMPSTSGIKSINKKSNDYLDKFNIKEIDKFIFEEFVRVLNKTKGKNKKEYKSEIYKIILVYDN